MDELNETIKQIVDLVLPQQDEIELAPLLKEPDPELATLAAVREPDLVIELLKNGTLHDTDLVSALALKSIYGNLQFAQQTTELQRSKIESMNAANFEWAKKTERIFGIVRQMIIDHDIVKECEAEIEALVDLGMKPMTSDYSYTVSIKFDISGTLHEVPYGVGDDELAQVIEDSVADWFEVHYRQTVDIDGENIDVSVDVDDTIVERSWVSED